MSTTLVNPASLGRNRVVSGRYLEVARRQDAERTLAKILNLLTDDRFEVDETALENAEEAAALIKAHFSSWED